MPQSGRAGYVEARETERDALGWAQVPKESPPHCAPPSSPPLKAPCGICHAV